MITISEQLAQALLTCLRLGTFQLQYAQIKEVEDALLAAVAAANVPVEEVGTDEAVAEVVSDFPGGVIDEE